MVEVVSLQDAVDTVGEVDGRVHPLLVLIDKLHLVIALRHFRHKRRLNETSAKGGAKKLIILEKLILVFIQWPASVRQILLGVVDFKRVFKLWIKVIGALTPGEAI